MALAPNQARHVLAGGARLFTASLPDRPSASLALTFTVGSRYEPDAIGGAAHFVEHLLFKGTRRRPTSKAIAEAIEGIGGEFNAETDKEFTSYWARVPAERLELAVDVLFDIVSNSRLAPEDVEKERMVILEELKMYVDQPQDYVHTLFEGMMWPGQPLGRDIAGTVESVSAISREELVEYIRRHYSASRLVAGVAGGIDAQRAVELIGQHLRLRAGRPAPEFPVPGRVEEPNVLLNSRRTEQAHICLGVAALSYHDPDRQALELINWVLGAGMSSRLFLEIRERRGLAYDVHSFTSQHRDTGYFAVYMGVDPKKASEAVDATLNELRQMSILPVPEDELRKAKEFRKGTLRLGQEGTSAQANWMCQQELRTGVVKSVEEVVASFESLTPEDLMRVATRILTGPVQLAVIGPFGSDARFRRAVAAS